MRYLEICSFAQRRLKHRRLDKRGSLEDSRRLESVSKYAIAFGLVHRFHSLGVDLNFFKK